MKCYFIFNFSLYQSPSFVYDLFNWRFYKHHLNYLEILVILQTLFNKLSWNKIVVLSCFSVLDNTSSFHAWINSKHDIMVSLKSFLPKFIDQWYTVPGVLYHSIFLSEKHNGRCLWCLLSRITNNQTFKEHRIRS